MTELRTIFDDTFTMLNIVATEEQKETAFRNTSREFFSYVSPVLMIPNEKYIDVTSAIDITIGYGYEDDIDIFNVGIGDFKIVEISELDEFVALRIKPVGNGLFYLEDGYIGAFQQVTEYFLKKLEKDNMRMLKSAGIDDGEGFEVEDIQTIRDYLRKEFGVTTAGLVM